MTDLGLQNPGTEDIPLSSVSRILGVPMPTLRSWELRYGIPAQDRPSGKHRRYSGAELHAMRLMRDEIARGNRASAAAAVVRDLLASSGPAKAFVDGFLAAAEAGNPSAVRENLDLALQALGLGPCIDEVLLPAMQQVGAWWQTGRCDVDQERLTTETTRAWLERQSSAAPPAIGDQPPIILACGPSDLHTVGLECFALLLRYRGYTCRVLGARTPSLALTTAVEASGTRAVVLASHLGSGRHRAVQSIKAVATMGVEVFYAGNAFVTAASRRGLPGHYLGTNLQAGCQLIDDAIRVA